MKFNLIPTEPLEYKIYADLLEDQGTILTTSIRHKILPLDGEDGHGYGCIREIWCDETVGSGDLITNGDGDGFSSGSCWDCLEINEGCYYGDGYIQPDTDRD